MRIIRTKLNIDHFVAAALGRPLAEVQAVTGFFLDALMLELADEAQVSLPGFGTISLVRYRSPVPDGRSQSLWKTEVRIRKGRQFRRVLREYLPEPDAQKTRK